MYIDLPKKRNYVKNIILCVDFSLEETWNKNYGENKYSMILAHYLTYELKDAETMIARASRMLSKDGVMSLDTFQNENQPIYTGEGLHEANHNLDKFYVALKLAEKIRDR